MAVNGDRHVAKRQRVEDLKSSSTPSGSRIFAPYRTLGLVSPTEVPFTAVPLGKTTFQVTTSIGNSLQTYDLRRGLQLVFITRPETPHTITATCAWKDVVFAAWGGGTAAETSGVWVFKREKRLAELEQPDQAHEAVDKLIVFGSWIVGCCASRIEVWRSDSYEHYTTITARATAVGLGVTGFSGAMCTMPTMLNKIFIGKRDGSCEIWNVSTGKLVYTISPLNLECGKVTALQPAPALFLLAIARADGSIIIHNVRTDKEILRLNQKRTHKNAVASISFRTDDLGAGEDGRKAGVMATAGLENGDITLWDLGGPRVMGVLRNAHNPPSSTQGGVAGGVTKVEFLPGQAVIFTSGRDNSIKSWIFDQQPFSPVPRILHSRSGHAAAVTRLDFLPVDADGSDAIGKWLLSAGRDQSLWAWSLRRDGQSTELSQGNIAKKARRLGYFTQNLETESSSRLEDLKAPEITCMACCMGRDAGMGTTSGGGPVWANVAARKSKQSEDDRPVSGWESVVTGHRGDKFARTWFWGRKKAGRWSFETSDGTEVTAVAMSPCGTFALIGSAGGAIDMFNLQSGIHRRRFPAPLNPAQARKLRLQQQNGDTSLVPKSGAERTFGPGQGKHRKEITGIIVDNMNRTVVSCGLDGKIKFWDFLKGTLNHEIDWYQMTAITAARYHRPSDLLALAADDSAIRVLDIETRKLVRELWGSVGKITDFCFSQDGRWVISASMDSVVRVWDLPTGHLIDAVRLEGACTALAFSVTGEFLATAHANNLGIKIWTNKVLFAHVPSRHVDEDEVAATLPSAIGEGGQALLEAAFEEPIPDGEQQDSIPSSTIDQLTGGMTTLSLVPRSRWQTLVHLDTIASRNKPIEPPKAPDKTPFFLPSLDKGPEQAVEPKQAEQDLIVTASERSRISALQRHTAERRITTLLQVTAEDQHHEGFFAHFKLLGPSAQDLEIRSLNPLSTPNELILFVHALTSRLVEKRDYELVQAWMLVFLRIHGELVGQSAELFACVKEFRQIQATEATRLGSLVGYCSGVVSFLRSAR